MCGLTKKIADHPAEEKPPEIQGSVQIFQRQRLNAKIQIAEELRGAAERGQSFRRRAAKLGIFEDADAEIAQVGRSDGADRDWRGEGVSWIGACHDCEERGEIGDGAGHRADDANPREGACTRREVARGGNAAGRGLESADAREVGGSADGAAAVAADSAHGAARGDGRGFAAAGAAGGIGGIPGIGSFAGEAIVCFVSHQEFGRVGVAEEDGSGVFEARNDGGVGVGNVILAEEGAGGAGPSSDVERGFDGERNSFEGAGRIAGGETGFGFARAGEGGFGVDVDEGI